MIIIGFFLFKVFAMPVFDTLESCLVQKFHFDPSRTLRVVARSIYVGKINIVLNI